jgi:hypothetical protein
MKLRTFVSRLATLTAAAGLILSTHSLTVRADAGGAGAQDPDANYDRLDGTGASGKRVDVIEWENNLEIHVYPKGSTAGLGMKIDDKNGKKVMVIAYRFVENPKKTLTRRNILGIPLSANFKVYKDPMENEFDKFIISNNGLSGQVIAYRLDPTPTQLYPEGTPAYADSGAQPVGRAPASATDNNAFPSGLDSQSQGGVDDSGSIPFKYDRGGRH